MTLRAQEGTNVIPKHNHVTGAQPHNLNKHNVLAPVASEDCRAVGSVLALVGDKWSVLIIVTLGDGALRFNEIKRRIGGISQRMLTLTLRGLERDGLVTRTQFAAIPPRVEYELTALGRSLWQVVEPLGVWARAHIEAMKSARESFDQRNGGGTGAQKS
jgi:DNA-binding HxlR family transcriptional regulator